MQIPQERGFTKTDISIDFDDEIEKIVKNIYRGDGIYVTDEARAQIERLEALGFGNIPVCMAKTQYSLSDNPALLGSPRDFDITVREVRVSAGAGFVVALTGDVMTMPGLPKVPAANNMDVDSEGRITGLF